MTDNIDNIKSKENISWFYLCLCLFTRVIDVLSLAKSIFFKQSNLQTHYVIYKAYLRTHFLHELLYELLTTLLR